MGISKGTVTFSDGTTKFVDYQNTSDYVISALKDNFNQSLLSIKIQEPLVNQPLLANVFVDYGPGLHWASWCTNEKTQLLINHSREDEYNFNSSHYYTKDDNDVVHLGVEYMGFGYCDTFLLCGSTQSTHSVSMKEAEGKLCLNCINKHLRLI